MMEDNEWLDPANAGKPGCIYNNAATLGDVFAFSHHVVYDEKG